MRDIELSAFKQGSEIVQFFDCVVMCWKNAMVYHDNVRSVLCQLFKFAVKMAGGSAESSTLPVLLDALLGRVEGTGTTMVIEALPENVRSKVIFVLN